MLSIGEMAYIGDHMAKTIRKALSDIVQGIDGGG
jgi:hypothetical protein